METTGTRPVERPAGLGGLGYRLAFVARQARAGFEQRLVDDTGVSFAAWTVLETLTAHGPMIQRDLAETLEITGQTLARQVDRMVASGWLRRDGVAHDRRATRISVTSQGQVVHQRVATVTKQANEQLTQGMSESEIATLDALLTRVLANTYTSR
ncbi:transcriptional regulator [Pseudonocardia ammonioxydans]|uniref:Transcriptional regulator n=1 Tax=Pseudonocardia ammonioxydans TaxID=260086 RepID=A0A1I5IHV2_PSUAM|nr:MarR family transcriptional regulator [Pseudonocardia ammonioxydans]SFO59651.1 transcriptional regulator [Pseudonocardia ammonioxydans]